MKRTILLLFALGLIGLQGCVQEEIILVQEPIVKQAELNYSYYLGLRIVEVEGEIVNRGNIPLAGAQIRFRLFDEDGYLITTLFRDFNLNVSPGDGIYFYSDFVQPGTFDVKADIWDVW